MSAPLINPWPEAAAANAWYNTLPRVDQELVYAYGIAARANQQVTERLASGGRAGLYTAAFQSLRAAAAVFPSLDEQMRIRGLHAKFWSYGVKTPGLGQGMTELMLIAAVATAGALMASSAGAGSVGATAGGSGSSFSASVAAASEANGYSLIAASQAAPVAAAVPGSFSAAVAAAGEASGYSMLATGGTAAASAGSFLSNFGVGDMTSIFDGIGGNNTIFDGITGTIQDIANTAVSAYSAVQGVQLQRAQIDAQVAQAQAAQRVGYSTATSAPAGGINWGVVCIGVGILALVIGLVRQ